MYMDEYGRTQITFNAKGAFNQQLQKIASATTKEKDKRWIGLANTMRKKKRKNSRTSEDCQIRAMDMVGVSLVEESKKSPRLHEITSQ